MKSVTSNEHTVTIHGRLVTCTCGLVSGPHGTVAAAEAVGFCHLSGVKESS